MVRATAAEVLKLKGGVTTIYGWDSTAIGNLCAQADALIDTAALPGSLSTTGTNEVALANRAVLWLIEQSVAGLPLVLSDDLKEEIAQLAADTTFDGWATVNMIDEDE